MSVARAAGAVLRPTQRAGISLVQHRAASSHAHEDHHDDHHHEEYHDSNVYEPEVFNTPFWRRVVVAGVGIVAFYKFAPEPTEDTLIAKYIKSTMTQPEFWKDTAFKHLVLSAQGSDETLLVADAKPPVVHRYRFPQRFEQFSPHSNPVGIKLTVDDVVVKRD
ncbi:hypothetical protein BD309DRAFT_960775 [Dichomitus squalens]|uniref:Uncharacterized protein n=1 Tax=Dichomitus squalens TaxID=114155 RepID=A0A4Q9QCV8_9APHY|nr:hypothetical protein BD309DRAFT_960775 [Dichomitus squalens]TBU64554.1 hypothetical protein BD310DRAFT_839745 [Dichomitus squalens]